MVLMHINLRELYYFTLASTKYHSYHLESPWNWFHIYLKLATKIHFEYQYNILYESRRRARCDHSFFLILSLILKRSFGDLVMVRNLVINSMHFCIQLTFACNSPKTLVHFVVSSPLYPINFEVKHHLCSTHNCILRSLIFISLYIHQSCVFISHLYSTVLCINQLFL